MKKKRIFFILMVLVLVLFLVYFVSKDNEFKDNYYLSINDEVIEDNVLGDNEYNWSYFGDTQEIVDDKTSLIVKDILNGNGLSKKEVNTIKGLYNKALDMNKRDKDGINALEFYLDKVSNVSTVDELVEVIILIEKELGIGLLTNVEIVQDYKDNKRNIIYFSPITYAFGASSDYMVDEDYMTYKAYIKRACVQLWKVYGLETKEAREVVKRVFEFYEGVSNSSLLASELADIVDYYKIVTEDDINNLFSNVEGKYLSRRDIGSRDVYSLVDKVQYQYLNDSLTMDNLDVWKEVIITKILSSYAVYGSSAYVEVVNNLNDALLGSNDKSINEEQAEEIVKSLFSSEIDKVYESKYLTNKHIEEIEKIFLEIKDIFKIRLENNKWLSKKARDKAMVKLDKMKVIVGLDGLSGYNIAEELDISNRSLISDVIKIQQLVMKDDLERLDSGEKRNLVGQVQVNAYYQPLDNSIVIPVAFFELIDENANYYEKLGTFGMILAHEVTHAFDGNGSLFDENGNLNNWWSKEDKKIFEKLKDDVSNYYNKYEVLNGKYINGEKTVNENIADLGAVACIVDIAKNNKANNEEMKLMFSSLASIWASRESEAYMELLLLQDVHAPNQFRVNAVLSSTEEFYNVYDIYPWDDMWIPKKDRVMVW